MERTRFSGPGKYIDFPGDCPWCGEETELDYGDLEFESGCVWQKVSCSTCHGRWNEVYQAWAVEACDNDWNTTSDPRQVNYCRTWRHKYPLWKKNGKTGNQP
jgi:hypothetical protein